MLRPCPDTSNCPPFDPVGNFSSEADDTLDFLSTVWSPDGTPPPFLQPWTSTNCGFTYVSSISQLDADQHAAAGAVLCITQDHCTIDCQIFVNSPQTCCTPCPDGTNTCYTLPGGIIVGPSQAGADAQALLIACNLVRGTPVCLGNLAGCICLGDNFAKTITANRVVEWSLDGGLLPPGLVLTGGTGRTTDIIGIPTANGQYTFAIKGQSLEGPFSIKRYTITVLEITTTSLPPFTVGVPYSFQMVADGGSGNYNWRITSGSLPAGLTMSVTGLISGTPT